MLFIVPEATEKPAGGDAPGGIKVELDLDDAPFLEEDEPAPAPAPEPEAAPEKSAETAPAKIEAKPGFKALLKARLAGLLGNKKRLIIIGGSAGLLIVLAVVVNVFLFGEKKPDAPKAPEKPAPVYEVVSGAPAPLTPAKAPYAHLVQWEPFLIEQRGEDGGLRFVTCKIAIPAADDAQYVELTAKRVVLRDAVYYFLSNRPPELLSTPEKNKIMRDDIVGVLNGHLATVLKDVYIEEYLVTAP